MSGITVSNLCKTYIVNKRQNNVLRNVNLTLEEKEMIAVMGPSGSGKTTLLYTISGMDSATAGSVKFFERELTDMSRNEISDLRPVSYTHLDVYKRQCLRRWHIRRSISKKTAYIISDTGQAYHRCIAVFYYIHMAIVR